MSKRKAPAPRRGKKTHAWELWAYLAIILGATGCIVLGSKLMEPRPQVTTVVEAPKFTSDVDAELKALYARLDVVEAKARLAALKPPPIKSLPAPVAPGINFAAMRAQTVELLAAGKGPGSGVIISPNFILTVNHVATMADGAPLDVLFSDGTKAHAALVWTDKKRDVALMALDRATKIKPAKLATGLPKVGDETWSAGYPLYMPLSIIHGSVISIDALDKGYGDQAPSTISIAAPIARGDSGGPTFNAAGEVVGLNDTVFVDALPGMMPAPFYFGLAGIIGTQFIAADVRAVVGI